MSELLYSPATATAVKDKNPKPCGRINPSMAVVGNTLLLFGGVLEVGDKELTLDDIWSLDLAKLDKWSCRRELSVELPRADDPNAFGSDEESGDDEKDGED